MSINRKRARSSPEDETEFMPLSKRINNLHINPSMLFEQQNNLQLGSVFNGEWIASNIQFHPGPANLLDSPPLSTQSNSGWNQNMTAQYNPELSERQNPHYYTSNKLLYEMYLARQQRNMN